MAQKVRVFKIAQDFNIDNDTAVSKIMDMGIDVRNYMSALDVDTAARVRRTFEQEREENTVEEHIRPTVVRRRSKGGAPPKAVKKRPPKKELEELKPLPTAVAEEETEAAPKVKKTRKKAKTVKPAAEEAAVAEVTVAEAEEEAAPKKKAKKAATKKAATKKAATKKAATKKAATKKAAAAKVEEPEVVEEETTAAPVDEPALEAVPDLGQAEEAPDEEEVALEEAAEVAEEEVEAPAPKIARKIEVAMGPAIRRPASEAPVVKRRISPTTAKPRRGGAEPERTTPVMPSEPSPAAAAGRGGRRAVPRRKREVEQKEIAPPRQFGGGGGRPVQGFGRKRRMVPGKKAQKTELTTPKASKRVIRIEEQITLQELARRMGVKATELLMQLIGLGVSGVNINTTLDSDTAKIVASEFGYDVENVAIQEDDLLASTRAEESDEEKKLREVRPPVVTVMGHVDHGKTSLLDRIRKADVAAGEAGGITQHIGAYRVKTKQGMIAFVDTPGHAAFTAMRARGANVTDVVILVTAADDGVMPQTIEAINHSRAAGVPIIVAINKCDLPGADPDKVRRELMEQNLIPEELGGDIIVTEVSAKTGDGVDKLLEMVSLQSEVMELTSNPKRPGSGIVLEAYLDKGRGPVANVLVKEGMLKTGDVVVAGSVHGKVRALTDDHGRKVSEAHPSTPVEVLGLSGVPEAGGQFDVVDDMKLAEKVSKSQSEKTRAAFSGAMKPSLEALYEQMQAAEQVELKAIIKADVQGSVEALKDAFQKLSTEKVKLFVVHASVGGITESDVNLATTAGAIIVGFNVRPAGKSRKTAEEQGVEIRLYSVIYEALDELKKAMAGLLAPTIEEETLGQAEVRDTFTIPKIGTIAGSYVTDGKIQRNAKARLVRDSVQIWEGKLGSLRRFKDDVKEVASGFECGIGLEGYNDVKVGDVIEFYVEKEVEATL